jgi:hypothetical protein
LFRPTADGPRWMGRQGCAERRTRSWVLLCVVR